MKVFNFTKISHLKRVISFMKLIKKTIKDANEKLVVNFYLYVFTNRHTIIIFLTLFCYLVLLQPYGNVNTTLCMDVPTNLELRKMELEQLMHSRIVLLSAASNSFLSNPELPNGVNLYNEIVSIPIDGPMEKTVLKVFNDQSTLLLVDGERIKTSETEVRFFINYCRTLNIRYPAHYDLLGPLAHRYVQLETFTPESRAILPILNEQDLIRNVFYTDIGHIAGNFGYTVTSIVDQTG